MNNKSNWAILTAGNQLCIDVLTNLLEEKSDDIACIIIDNETNKWKKSNKEKIKLNYKYYGILGVISLIKSKILKKQKVTILDDSNLAIKEEIIRLAQSLNAETLFVDDINSQESIQYINSHKLKYGMVIGTSILKKPIIESVSCFMVNIHQGKIPEYRGGSIVFWSLFNADYKFSVTTHKVEVAVDSGEIYMTDSFECQYDFNKFQYDYNKYISFILKKLHIISVPIIVKTITQINKLKTKAIPVHIEEGHRYRKPTFKEKKMMLQLLKQRKNKL